MENLSQNAQQSIVFLVYASTLLLVIIGVVFIKLMLDVSTLVKSLQKIMIIIKPEIGPTIKELKRTLININSLANKTDTQFQDINKAISNTISAFSGSGQGFPGKAKFVLSSLKKGVLAGFKVFLEGNKTS